MPSPYALRGDDARLIGTHWAFDLGAAALTHEMAARFGCSAVLSNFSRLIIDPNREASAPTLIRDTAEGLPVQMNVGLSDAERENRLQTFYRPYHDAIDRMMGSSEASVLLSLHSFTPVYEGATRPMELGVLFDEEEELAEDVREALVSAGFVVAMNEPYSGKAGLIYCVERHAKKYGCRALELELRQDLAVQPAERARVIEALGALFL